MVQCLCRKREAKLVLIGLILGALLLLILGGLGFGSKTAQPISFSHKKHTAQGLSCDTCHIYFKTQTFSGMPRLETCLDCHKDPVTKSPEEEKIRDYQKKNQEISWARLYVQPDHVFFSHRRHVVLGKMDCQTCHGAIGESDRPPSKPWVKMTMKWCMDCHSKKQVTNDCLACHV